MSLFSKLFGKPQEEKSQENSKRKSLIIVPAKRHTDKKPQELDISQVNYISLPKAPANWEAKEQKYGKKDWDWFKNSNNYQLYCAYNEMKYNKAISYFNKINEKDIHGMPGSLLLKSYRKIIENWKARNKPNVAIKWSAEMLERLPHLITDMDRRKHNKLIDQLDIEKVKHSFKKVEIVNIKNEEEPKFKLETKYDWIISNITTIPKEKRSDISLKDSYFYKEKILNIDTKSKKKEFESYKAIVSYSNAEDYEIAQGLEYDIYRRYINYDASGLAFLSTECIMHVYDSDINQISKIDLKTLPQVKKIKASLEEFNELKRIIRCIAVSPTLDKYLFTIIDEAWCIDRTGNTLWCLKSPVKKGFTKFSTRVEKVALKSEIEEALQFMGLSFPYDNEKVKKRYRELAKKYHPDLNPNDINVKSKFQKLQSCYEYLTGSKPPIIETEYNNVWYRDDATYSKDDILGIATLEMGIMYGGITGVDWIYSASFSNKTDHTFIGTYSGRIIELDSYGNAITVFDIGSVPNSIIETEKNLYISTDTRLYLLKENKLQSIQDVFEQGKLIIYKDNFGLVTKNKLQLFSNDGDKILEIISKDALQKVFITNDNLKIETKKEIAKVERKKIS